MIALVGLSYSRSTMGTLSANFRSLGKEMMLMQAVDDHGDKPSADVAFRGVAALTNIL